jgi:glycosyltransferase involved in cell wall biosynthesis
MKILICTFTFPPDSNGVAAVTAAHARHFADAGHEVSVATGIPSGGELPSDYDHLHVRRFNVTGNAHFKCPYRGEHREYVEFVRNWRGDIAFFHCWGSWATDLLLSHMSKLPFRTVMVSHGFNAQRYPQNMRFPRGLRHWLGWQPYVWRLPGYLRAISHLVVLSPSTDPRWYYDHATAKKIGMRNLSVIPSGIHLDEFDIARDIRRDELHVSTSRMVLVVGNYFPEHKNQAYALRAFASCKPDDCTLVFIGSKFNEYSEHLKAEAMRLGVSTQVRFHASLPRDLVCAAYRNADLVLCSSLWESGPIVLLEAMAAGTPFISVDVGFAKYLKGGVIVDSEQAMADEMQRLLADECLRESLGKEGRRSSENTYSWKSVMMEYDALLDRLVSPSESENNV